MQKIQCYAWPYMDSSYHCNSKRFTYHIKKGNKRESALFVLIMNKVCPSALITRKLINLRNWQVFWLAPSSMPSHSHRNSGFWSIEDTFGAYSSGVCSGFSPDSLFTHHLKKRGDKHQNQKQIYNNSGSPPNFYLIKKATIVFYKQYIIKQEKHLKSLFQTLEVHIIVSVVLFCKCCHNKVRKLTATQKGLLSIFMFIGLSRTFR